MAAQDGIESGQFILALARITDGIVGAVGRQAILTRSLVANLSYEFSSLEDPSGSPTPDFHKVSDCIYEMIRRNPLTRFITLLFSGSDKA